MFERIAVPDGAAGTRAARGAAGGGGPAAKSPFNRLKQPARRASWSRFTEQVGHLRWVDSLGDTEAWLEGVAESKIADFAGEAAAADADALMRE